MAGGADSTASGPAVGASVLALGADRQGAAALVALTEGTETFGRVELIVAADQVEAADPLELVWLFRGEPAGPRQRGVGAALSHLAVWRAVAQRPRDCIELVLEDVAGPAEDFRRRLPRMIAALHGTDFDLALLGYRSAPAEAEAEVETETETETETGGGVRAMRWERYLGGACG